MAQPTPTQELVTKDLHGIEWRFKHIFRGHYVLVLFETYVKRGKIGRAGGLDNELK